MNKEPDWSSIYWDCQSALLQSDPRFLSDRFGSLFMRTVKQRIYRIQQEHNINNITLARQSIITFNSNIDSSKTEPIKDIAEFLPYPIVWRLFTEQTDITRSTAKLVVDSYGSLPDEVQSAIVDEYSLCRMLLDI